MEFDQFKEELNKTLSIGVKEQLSGTLRTELIPKSGGPKHGITYMSEGGTVGMTFYAEDAYKDYQNGDAIEQIADRIFQTIKEYWEKLPVDMDFKEIIKPENIIPELIPAEGNEEFLKMVPHVPFGNLQIIFKFNFPDFSWGAAKADVSYGYLEQLGWNEEKLLAAAVNNPIYKDDIRLLSLVGAMFGMQGKSVKDDLSFLDDLSEKMVVITNASKEYGASAILDKDAMSRVAEAFGGNVYILPINVDECILTPEDEMLLEDLRELLYKTNHECVPPEERLSDEIYRFDSITKEITMASDQKERSEHQEPKDPEPQRR